MTFDLAIQIYLWGLIPAGFIASLLMWAFNDTDFTFDTGITFALCLFWPATPVVLALVAVWWTITKGGTG